MTNSPPKTSDAVNAVARNVLGQPLVPCSFDPLTGFYRDGCCKTGAEDVGTHVLCAVVTQPFLAFSKTQGNDLSTPRPQWNFEGLEPGDAWCLCVTRWIDALRAGCAPKVKLESTHIKTLEFVALDVLQANSVEFAPD
jgi:uncharacterized protein